MGWFANGAAPRGFEIRIKNNPPSVPDTVVGPETGEQLGSVDPPRNRIGAADGIGDFHVDLQWTLEPNNFPSPAPPDAFGAYGVMLTLGTTAAGVEDSDPLLYVFNLGLDEPTFEEALEAFAALLSPGPAADFDSDGDVDGDDFLAWQSGFGIEEGATRSDGDADGDGDVDGDDFLSWQAGFSPAAAAGNGARIPEPASGLVASLGGLAGMFALLRSSRASRRRNRRWPVPERSRV